MKIRLLALVLMVLGWAPLAHAVDVCTILGNCGFDNDPVHSRWTATTPNGNYDPHAPQVNPVIYPNLPLLAPPGGAPEFVGVLNPGDADINGKLVHDAVPGAFAAGLYTATVCATRGHLLDDPPAAGTDVFIPNVGTPSPELRVQFFFWGAGSQPVVDINDDWSRNPTVKSASLPFTAWTNSGQWACQIFGFAIASPKSYLALSISALNHRQTTFVAFDVLD